MSNNHWSDCALHNMPAYAPRPCSCGNVKPRWYSPLLNVWQFLRYSLIYWAGRA